MFEIEKDIAKKNKKMHLKKKRIIYRLNRMENVRKKEN